MTGRPDGGGALGTRSRSGDCGLDGGDGVVGWGADGGTRQWWWRPRETVFTQEYIEEPDNERGQSDFFSECADKFGEIGDVYTDGKKTSGSTPDTMIEHVALAGSCAAPTPVTEHSPTATGAAPDTVIEYVATAGTCAAPAPVTEYVPTAANAAPDTVIEYVALAGTCAAPAPASARCRVHCASTSSVLCCTSAQRVLCRTSARRRVQRASTSGSPRFSTEHAPTNACATPDTLIEYVASAGTCAAPAPVFEAEWDEDASPKSTYGPLETMHIDEAASRESSEATVEPGQEASDGEDSESDAPYTPELDIVFDALVELAGDGRCWVPVRLIQAQTSLQLWRLEELFEEWGCMGVICRDDMRRNVAFGSSVADALGDEH